VIIAETYGALVLLAFLDLKKDFPVFSILRHICRSKSKKHLRPSRKKTWFPENLSPLFFVNLCGVVQMDLAE
jgi:hypothetical protein